MNLTNLSKAKEKYVHQNNDMISGTLTTISNQKKTYLISTNTHWNTPAVPVHADGPDSTRASCINRPTEAAKETNETT